MDFRLFRPHLRLSGALLVLLGACDLNELTPEKLTGRTGDSTDPDGGDEPDDPEDDAGTSPGEDEAGQEDAGSDLPSARFVPSDDGIALVQAGTLSQLVASVTISDGVAPSSAWAASSDAPWLQLEKDGGTLTVRAVPETSGQGLHLARVQLTPAPDADAGAEEAGMDGGEDAGAQPPADAGEEAGAEAGTPPDESLRELRVSLWVGAATPEPELRIATAYTHVVADPVRPYVYAHAGGSSISVYHVYTGQLVRTVADVAPRLGHMAVSSNGASLYVADATNFTVVRVDLGSSADHEPTPVPYAIGNVRARFAYARVNGQGLLLTGAGTVHDASSGTALSATLGAPDAQPAQVVVSASSDGSRACLLNVGANPYVLRCYALAYGGSEGPTLRVSGEAMRSEMAVEGEDKTGVDLALAPNGRSVYLAAAGLNTFRAYDTDTLMDPVQEPPGATRPANNVEVSEQGMVLYGAPSPNGETDLWLFEARGNQLRSTDLTPAGNLLLPRQLAFSGDGLRVVALSDEPALVFLSSRP